MTPTPAPRLRTLILLLLAVTGALLAGAAPASAHAALTGSDPAQGAVVGIAPTRVSLTFSEEVAMGDDALRVLDPRGNRVDAGRPAPAGGTTYSVALRGGLRDGTYTVTYQVVSADSHPVSGAYTFSVGAPSRTVVSLTGQGAGGGLVGALYGIGRYASYAGFALLVGGAAFVLVCLPRGSGVRPVQRLVVSGWVALTAGTLGLLLLRGSYTTSGRLRDVADMGLLGQVLHTGTGTALVSRLLLLAAAAPLVAVLFGSHRKREGEERWGVASGPAVGGLAVAVGLAASWATSEHASTGLQSGIAVPVDVVHLLAVAAWLGGLAALLVALQGAPAGAPVDGRAVRRFSAVAFGSVVVLIATGTYQSWRQLGSRAALTDTSYGRLLLVKLGLVALLVVLGRFSRRWTARLAATAPVPAGQPERGSAGVRRGTGPAARPERPSDPLAAPRSTAGADPGPERAAGSGTGAAPGPAADPAAGSEGAGDASGHAGPGGPDPERAAQLARQRAAREAALRRRLRDADPNRSGLRRSVLAEAAVAVVLLAVTTLLTQTEPGRTAEQARAAASAALPATTASPAQQVLDMPFDTGGRNGKGVISIGLAPARPGRNTMHLLVTDSDGRPLDVPEIKAAFTLKARDLGPLSVVPDHIATGHWSASGVQLPLAGVWKVAVTVRTSDFDQVTVSKNAQIG
ncbi:copper resistance CopC/CopD family protein [Streptomyces sp. MS06]|uniref:copper resistance CopC/CopD family protein n=1 Tax=Streptomyces sp. MS06 TaxID=3385974 RepID=UPI0039A36A50